MTVRLHDYVLSAECYKVRLLLRMLGVAFETVKVDVHPGRENTTRGFLALNPLGSLPVLEVIDDEPGADGRGSLVLADAQAILVYLATRYDTARSWLPLDAAAAGQIAMWLAFAGQEFADLSVLRMQCFTGAEPDRALMPRSRRALEVLDDHLAMRELAGHTWMVGDSPTIADLAVLPSAAMAPDAGIMLDGYQAVWRWIARVKRLPGFFVIPGVHPILPGEA